jgi:endoglucanase
MQFPFSDQPALFAPTTLRRRLALLAASLSLAACAELPFGPVIPAAPAPEVATDSRSMPNPMRGASLYVNPNSSARRSVEEWRGSRPADAALLEKIASQPLAIWIGDWFPDPHAVVSRTTRAITDAGALPVYVLYAIPLRDCGQYSAGGVSGAAAYGRWISEVARGIGDQRAVVVLEPDALAGMDCLSAREQEERTRMIREAVHTLTRSGRVAVYLDAGNARWHAPDVVAARLRDAGIDGAAGFALNVSNFLSTEESVRYGEAVSARVGGKHFVVDTSRNGRGPTADAQWCNPAERALGAAPTTATGHPLVDALLWIKTPGESDGECNGGPAAGKWWAEYALGLARRASW